MIFTVTMNSSYSCLRCVVAYCNNAKWVQNVQRCITLSNFFFPFHFAKSA